MGRFPHNWTSETSRTQKAVARAAVEGAQSNAGQLIGSQLGVSVRYDAETTFPPTGMRGYWEVYVERPHRKGDPQIYFRQDKDEASDLVGRSL